MKKKIILKKLLPFYYSALTSFPFIEKDFDALTQYEILQAIIDKINDIIPVTNDLIENIDDIVGEKLDELVEDGTLENLINVTIFEKLKIFYVPEDFGGVGDGNTDCTDAFDKACKAMDTGNIKMLFIPAGKTYLIKGTIAIPNGCTLFGAGESSRIYYDETDTHIGIGITNGGETVTIENVRIDHRSNGLITFDSQAGAVGISSVSAVGLMDEPSASYTSINKQSVYIRNLYCSGRYPLQCEPSSGYTIDMMVADGVHSPIGLVSFMSRDGRIKELHYSNIYCDTIRCGADQASEYAGNATLDNFYCKYIRAFTKNLKIRDGVIDCSGNSNNEFSDAMLLKTDIPLDHIHFIGGDSQHINAIRLRRDSAKPYVLTDCVIDGFSNTAFLNTIGSTTPYVILHDCDITNTPIAETVKLMVYGGTVPYVAGDKIYPRFYYNERHAFGASDGHIVTVNSGVQLNYSTFAGNKLTFRLLLSIPSGYTGGDTLFNMPLEAPAQSHVFGTLYNPDTGLSRTVAVSIDDSGNASISDSYGYPRLIINAEIELAM